MTVSRRGFLKSAAALGALSCVSPAGLRADAEERLGGKPYEFLRDMLANPSPSGYEKPVQQIWKKYTEKFAEVTIDSHGNAIGVVNRSGAPRLMLAGHCDEIGFMVKYIDGDGFIYFAAMGGFDESIIPGRRVEIHAESGPVTGVIGKGPIHLMSASDRNIASKIGDLCIDIGASSRQDAEQLVMIGDPITYTCDFIELRNGLAVARGFDDRIGSFMVAETLRNLDRSKNLRAAVHGVSTVQEEIGLRGAHTSAFGIDPQVALATDVTHATDYPGMNKKQAGDIRLGGGPVISRGPNINPRVFDLLVRCCEHNEIPYQVLGAPRGTGTDANAIQLTRAGVATGLVSIPLRYMHTPVETLAVKDILWIIQLMTVFAEALEPGMSFVP